MKRIKLRAYFARNLGDDLMVDILLRRYPQHKFWVNNTQLETEVFRKYPNFENRAALWEHYGRRNHIANLLTLNRKKDFLLHRMVQQRNKGCNGSVYIGGSLFMEGVRDTAEYIRQEEEKLDAGPLFIIGANFGPYETEGFRAAFEEYFKKCAGITFRDQASYRCFATLDNAAYAPDVVLNLPDAPKAGNGSVIISVIDVRSRPKLKEYTQSYDRFIADTCQTCVAQGKKPVLMSFCESEGDCAAIERIKELLPVEIREKTGVYAYNGNIPEALEQIAQADFVLATRFHAMILALCFEKPFFCLSYSDKIKWVLEDLGCDAYCDLKQISTLEPKDIFARYTQPVDAAAYRREAQRQFAQLDEFLRK